MFFPKKPLLNFSKKNFFFKKKRIKNFKIINFLFPKFFQIELKGAEALKMDVTHEPGSPTEAVAPDTSLHDLYPLLAGPSPTVPPEEPADQSTAQESIDNRSTLDRLLDICLCRPSKSQLCPLAYTHKCLLLKLSQMPYDNSNGTHWLLLSDYFQNIQKALDPDHVGQPARVGAHWVTVGFQGATPETDFRGCGVLGLLQMHTFTQRIQSNLLKAIIVLATTEPNVSFLCWWK